MSSNTRLALLLAALLPAVHAPAADWPQWRGLNRESAWSETGLLESFPPEGLKVLWRARVGSGYSSPVVAQGRVHLHDVALQDSKARERVQTWDEATGKPLWTYSYDVQYPDWALDPKNKSGPNATPVVQDGKLYSLGQLGHLSCVDASEGKPLWQKDLGKDYQVKEFSSTPSPLIEGELLIHSAGGKPSACVIALDSTSGKEVWKALDETPTYSSPIVITAGGKRQLIVWTQESVTSLDPATGKPWWRQRLQTLGDYAVSTPVHQKDLLLLGGLMLKLDPEKPAASLLWPDSKATARRVLSNTSTPLLRGDLVFSARSSGELVCLEAGTGRQVWQTDQVTDLKNGASIHLTPNGDSVLLYTDRGELIRAQLSSGGYREIARARVLEPINPFGGRKVAWSPPAYADRRVFARNEEEIVCVSLAREP